MWGDGGEEIYRDLADTFKREKQAEGKLIKNSIEVLLLNNGRRGIQKGDSLHGYANPRKQTLKLLKNTLADKKVGNRKEDEQSADATLKMRR